MKDMICRSTRNRSTNSRENFVILSGSEGLALIGKRERLHHSEPKGEERESTNPGDGKGNLGIAQPE